MNLNNISDEELDRLFKVSAENFDPPFDPEAWAAMEQKLEMVQVRHSWFRRFYPYICLFGLVCLVGVFTIMNSKQPDETSTQSTASIERPQASPSEQRDEINNQSRYSTRSTKPIEPSTSDNKNADVNTSSRKTAEVSQQEGKIEVEDQYLNTYRSKKNVKGDKVNQRLALLPVVVKKATDLEKASKGKEEGKRDVSSDKMYRNSGAVTNSETVSEPIRVDKDLILSIDTTKTVVSAAESAKPVLSTDSVHNASIDSTNQNEASRPDKKSWFLNSVQIAVAVAPDLTTVKFKDPDGVSANAGILFGVPLTRRLSLVTGVIWANKVYSAEPEEYEFTNGYTYTSHIDATCKVLDIPLNLRYQVLEAGKNALAVQAGISSYVMLKEKYSSGYGGYYDYNYEVVNENRHWFKVQNVSLVYTRTISPVFSVGVEPFVKIPYAGIGAGKVKLTSAGMFFTAGYTLKLKP